MWALPTKSRCQAVLVPLPLRRRLHANAWWWSDLRQPYALGCGAENPTSGGLYTSRSGGP